MAITRPELSSSSSNSNSSTDVSIRSLELDSRSNSNFWENSYLKSDCSAKEQTGDHTHSIGSPAVESSGGGDKGTDPDTYTGALKIDNTNPIVETVINGEILEENDGGLSAVDSTVSSIEDSQIAVTTKVRRPKKKPRKPVQAYSEPYIIPPGHVWLAGDNTANSTDSRYYKSAVPCIFRKYSHTGPRPLCISLFHCYYLYTTKSTLRNQVLRSSSSGAFKRKSFLEVCFEVSAI